MAFIQDEKEVSIAKFNGAALGTGDPAFANIEVWWKGGVGRKLYLSAWCFIRKALWDGKAARWRGIDGDSAFLAAASRGC